MRCTAFSRLLTLHVKSILHFIRVDCHKVSFFLHAELYFMVLYFTCKSGESKPVNLNVGTMRKSSLTKWEILWLLQWSIIEPSNFRPPTSNIVRELTTYLNSLTSDSPSHVWFNMCKIFDGSFHDVLLRIFPMDNCGGVVWLQRGI